LSSRGKEEFAKANGKKNNPNPKQEKAENRLESRLKYCLYNGAIGKMTAPKKVVKRINKKRSKTPSL